MPKIISFINLKGGVGKTTNAVAISEFLALEHGKRVLVVDLDPQTNATIALIPQEKWEQLDNDGQTLLQLFKDKLDRTTRFDINQAIVRGVSNLASGIPTLSLLPSSLGLIEIQDQLALIPSGTFYAVSPVDILRDALRPVQESFEYIIIDCPPNLGIITLNGIAISTGYVIPVIPDILSTYGIPQIIGRIKGLPKPKALPSCQRESSSASIECKTDCITPHFSCSRPRQFRRIQRKGCPRFSIRSYRKPRKSLSRPTWTLRLTPFDRSMDTGAITKPIPAWLRSS